jgi:hypothetical protein
VKSFQAQTHYEVLEISVSASTAEVRSAYERLSRLYGDDQVVLYGMVDDAHAQALRQRLREAFEVLSDDARRDAYDVKLGLPPRELPPRPTARPSVPPGAGATGWGAFSWVSAPTPSAPPAGLSYVVPVPSAPTAPVAISIPIAAAPVVVREPAASQGWPPAAMGEVPAPVVRGEAPAGAVPGAAVAPTSSVAQAEPSRVPVEPSAPSTEPSRECAPAPLLAAETTDSSVPAPRVVEKVAEPPTQPPALAVAPTPAPAVAEAAVEVQPAAPREPEVPQLADDAEVAIVPVRTTSKEFRIETRPRPYEVPPGVEFNGDLLRQVRMKRGLTLLQLGERTRIGVKHLENVEADRYDALPAAVYLRGILMSVARELGLDGLRVSKSYLAFVEAHRSKG